MRATLFLLLSFVFLGLFLWTTLSGALFFLGCLFGLILLVITVGYQDTMLLFLLGAREVRSSDEKIFFEAASQESYKLAVKMPRLYFYNGSLERAFVFQTRYSVSLVLNKVLLEKASADELKAICFELLLQVKKGMAPKRTRSMFFLGFFSWIIHSFLGLFINLLPFKDVRRAADWFINFLFHPVLEVLFKLLLGEAYFKKLEQFLGDYPEEKELLARVGLKLRRPYSYYSLPSRKLLELQSVNKSRHFQNIMALEFLPHEWDFFFKGGELLGAE
jgi:hypothetical protein